jgi:deoxyribonuclease-4
MAPVVCRWRIAAGKLTLRLPKGRLEDEDQKSLPRSQKASRLMPLLGAHMSIAGGYFKAAEAAGALGMETVQLFTKNNNQWKGKALAEDDIRRFREALERHELKKPCAHTSYLINLASPDDALWRKSVDAAQEELRRAEALGLDGVVMHPGSYVSSSEDAGIERIIRGLDEIHRRCPNFRVQFWL